MTEIDDKMIDMFMKEHKKEVQDNGFSRRVMRRLPEYERRINRIWTGVCTVICVSLFFIFDGLSSLLGLLHEFFASAMHNSISTMNLQTLLIAGGVLIFLGIRKVCTIDF